MQLYKEFSEGCTFYDVVLNVYLSLNLMPKFIIDNNIKDINLVTTAGQGFYFDTDYIDDDFMNDKVIKNNYKFCTGKFFVNTGIRGNYLLIESGEILETETNNLFLI